MIVIGDDPSTIVEADPVARATQHHLGCHHHPADGTMLIEQTVPGLDRTHGHPAVRRRKSR